MPEAHPDQLLLDIWGEWVKLRGRERWLDQVQERASDAKAKEASERSSQLHDERWSLEERIVDAHPASAVGLAIQLRVLSGLLCVTPLDRPEDMGNPERRFRQILAHSDRLSSDALPPWDTDKDAED